MAPGRRHVAERLWAADDTGVRRLNAVVRKSVAARSLASRGAVGLAWIEVLLMGGLALGGRRDSAARMLAAVALVYGISEALGAVWARERPFARLANVEPLAAHTRERSFPSRHVASGLAMAAIGGRSHPRLGRLMAGVAWMLGLSRIAAGLHYPSDVLAGAALGTAVGRALRQR